MTKYAYDQVRTLCRERIAMASDTINVDVLFEERLVRLVWGNVSSGRFERVAAARSKAHPCTLAQYIDNVIGYLSSESARIDRLARGDADECNRLLNFLGKRAEREIGKFRRGIRVEWDARDFAQDAWRVIVEKQYPFDVPFEAWATRVLNNLILARYTRSADVLNRAQEPDSIDEPVDAGQGRDNSRGEILPDPRSLEPFEKIENQDMLRHAIAQLRSFEQREVTIATYFEELDDDQIAKRLHKTKQAIYDLRWRALARLKKILETG